MNNKQKREKETLLKYSTEFSYKCLIKEAYGHYDDIIDILSFLNTMINILPLVKFLDTNINYIKKGK